MKTRRKHRGAASPPESLGLYRLRDDLARHFKPCGSYEITLAGLAAQALERLQAAYEDERKYRAEHDMVETITTRLKEFEAITRNVNQCERAWHKAVRMIEDEQRRRKSETLASPNARPADDRPRSVPAPLPASTAVSLIPREPAPASVAVNRRE